MGRQASQERKETVCLRLTPDAIGKIRTLKDVRARESGWSSGPARQFTNSLMVEQAIQMYYTQKETEHKHPNTCGACGQKRKY